MSEPFLAEVRMVGFNFAPRGWAFCDGQILPINQNQSLYSLLGTTYGGDGRTSFALSDLRGRTPIHVGGGHPQAQKSGVETVTLSAAQMPNHDHTAQASSENATLNNPEGGVFGQSLNLYVPEVSASNPAPQAISAATVANVGGGQAHNNMQPYIAVNFCIALRGLFPSRN